MPRPEHERSDWTDTDLLTRDEARERLLEAMSELRAEYDERRTSGAADGEVAALAARLAAFESALDD